MIVGVPKEVKDNEYRIAMTPGGANAMVESGHTVLIQEGAGAGSGLEDEEYVKAGAQIVPGANEVWERAEMIIKIKETLPQEYDLMREGQTLFTYHHYASSRELTEANLKSGSLCIAYETIEKEDGSLPLLIPMSEVAGRMAVQEGAKFLEKPMSGRGILLGGVPGVEPATVVVLGGGIVGYNSAIIAAGMGAKVFILDVDLDRLRYLDEIMPKNVVQLYSTRYSILEKIAQADLVVGAVLITGGAAPKLIRKEDLSTMKHGAVIVDVAVDQGGCVETTRPTCHSEPTYIVDTILHYCVANMPGAVGRTSTFALTNATLPYALELANKGPLNAIRTNPEIAKGVNIMKKKLTYKAVAEAFDMEYTPLEKVL